MPTATTAEIRVAIKAALDNVTTGVTGWQTSAYMLSLPQPPTIDVYPDVYEFDSAMHRGLDTLHFIVRAMVAFNQDQGAQIRLDTLLDTRATGGLKTVLEADRTLGGVVQDIHVEGTSGYRGIQVDGVPALIAVEFNVLVYP